MIRETRNLRENARTCSLTFQNQIVLKACYKKVTSSTQGLFFNYYETVLLFLSDITEGLDTHGIFELTLSDVCEMTIDFKNMDDLKRQIDYFFINETLTSFEERCDHDRLFRKLCEDPTIEIIDHYFG